MEKIEVTEEIRYYCLECGSEISDLPNHTSGFCTKNCRHDGRCISGDRPMRTETWKVTKELMEGQ